MNGFEDNNMMFFYAVIGFGSVALVVLAGAVLVGG